jgi:O-acetyl-ADP-ribose deacetylase (regulator of RNase III)
VIDVRIDDLAFFQGSALVRPVNADLGATTPVLRRLETAGGPSLAKQLHLHEPLPVGAAVVTGAGDLGVELIVHGVVCSETEPVSRASVRRALTNALQRAVDWQIADVGIAPFGLGAGNLDIEDSAEIMAEVIAGHMQRAKYPARVSIIAESSHEEEVLSGAFQRIRR